MGLALERLPDWPVAMNRELALAYTGVAEAQLREWDRRGTVRFCMRGLQASYAMQVCRLV